MSRGGRGVLFRKRRVENTRKIDILGLKRAGLFTTEPGTLWRTTWTAWGAGCINYQLEEQKGKPSALRLLYSITNHETRESRDVDYCVRLDSTPCYFGGARLWFICPLVVNGVKCQRRARMLYLPPHAQYFGCRECYGLTYESRQISGSRNYALIQELNRLLKAENREEEKYLERAKKRAER